MRTEKLPQCILGNGDCPPKCLLYLYSKQITEAMGAAFDPQASRRMILLADAYNKKINVVQVAAVIAKCAEEPQNS